MSKYKYSIESFGSNRTINGYFSNLFSFNFTCKLLLIKKISLNKRIRISKLKYRTDENIDILIYIDNFKI